MSDQDFAASIFTSIILGLFLLPSLYCLKKNCSSQTKFLLIFWLVIVLALIVLLSGSVFDVLSSELSKAPFDPYELLSVTPQSTDKEIKSSFRELSKKYHPDKNPDFKDYYVMITRAYETLTSPEAKSNYERYGNPDGPTTFRISFGLPSFLFNQENKVLILIGFLVIVVIMPCFVVFSMRGKTEKDEFGGSRENYQIFFALLNDSLNIKQVFYMISACTEFHNLKISREQEKELNSFKEFLSYMPQSKQATPQMIKVIFLLAGRLENVKLSKSLYNDQQFILKNALSLLKSLISASFLLGHIQKSRRINFPAFELIIDIYRCLINGVYYPSNPIHLIDGVKDYKLYKDLKTVDQVKLKLQSKDWEKKVGQQEISNILLKLQEFPEYTIGVEASGDLALGSIGKFIVKASRKQEKAVEFEVDFKVKEQCWLFVCLDKRVIFLKNLDIKENLEEEVSVMFDKKVGFANGNNQLMFILKSDSFIGVESSFKLDFNIKSGKS